MSKEQLAKSIFLNLINVSIMLYNNDKDKDLGSRNIDQAMKFDEEQNITIFSFDLDEITDKDLLTMAQQAEFEYETEKLRKFGFISLV